MVVALSLTGGARAPLASTSSAKAVTRSGATGITQYLRNGGRRELAQQMGAHESPRTTALYDRRDGEVAVDKVARIVL